MLRLTYKDIASICTTVLCVIYLPFIYSLFLITIGYGFCLIYTLIKDRIKLGKREKRVRIL